MAGVTLKNITKNFGKKTILKNINLDILDGEFIVLAGASGCGKSTLLRLIAGLENPTKGEIFIDNNFVNKIPPKNRDIAMVFQSYALYPHLNVRENISLSLQVRKVAKCEINNRVERVCEILKLGDYINAKPKELSGGQRQRVALARAIVREPKVFLMDEPLSNLDAKLRNEMRSQIKKLHKRLGTTFIYVTHDQTEALTMGDRIAIMDKGIIQQIDTPQNIYNNPGNTFVASFMGTNPMNIIEGVINNGFLTFGNITLGISSVTAPIDNYDKVLIGVRPEKIATIFDPLYHFNLIKFNAQIDFEENLGSYKNIYFKLGEANFCCCTNIQKNIKETLAFSINPRDLHFFDYYSKQPIIDDTEIEK